MGADLYIHSLSDKCREAAEPKFNQAVAKRDAAKSKKSKDKWQGEVAKQYDAMYEQGYFRDSYNWSSVLWQLGLS